ncbi:hypothetical protein [Flavobacterium sp.]|jgi:hypothetical protein|uniref:hypothetical protein n=1 Tax=Flavobacterium sp. TaxID=239 RepID=UPI0037C1A231
MTYSTPLYGIPVPDGTSLAKNLPAELKAMGEGFEAALNAHVAIPVSNAAVVTATSAAARDSYWGNPTTETARLTLQARGATTIRTDKNITERFFATYDPTSNPQGMTPAGWYPIGSPASLIPTTRSAAERDAIFGTPSTSATQLELQNRGARTYRADLGVTEQYFALYNASTNPVGRDSAGWYSLSSQHGLVPVRATTVTFVSGTGSVNALGQITFSNCTKVSLDGLFTSEFKNYRVMFGCNGSSANTSIALRLRKNGTDVTSTQYNFGGLALRDSGSQTAFVGAGTTQFSLAWINGPATGSGSGSGSIDFFKPATDTYQTITSNFRGADGTSGAGIFTAGNLYAGQTEDGFSIYPASGTFSGTFSIYGYND